MDYQTQIDNLIELAIVQRDELKQLVEQLPQLRDYLSAEVEKKIEAVEPELRQELEDFFARKTEERVDILRGDVSERVAEILKSLEIATAAKYSALMNERARNAELLAQAEQKIAEAAATIPDKVKDIVTDELSRFPRAGEIDQLRKEFAEPRGLNPRGKWRPDERYNKLDLVSLNGDSYVSNIDDNTERPSRNSTLWTISAARGQGGGGGGPSSLTDLTQVPSDGTLLIGSGTSWVNGNIIAGTGVTVTNQPGSILIDATGAQEILTATVKNAEASTITKGQVVYLFSATGNMPSVKLAYNTSDATSAKTFGVVSSTSITPGGTGTVTCVGVLDGLNLGGYTDGDTVYLGATPGSITATKPYAPNHLVYVGIIERANAGNGELYVRIQNGYELDEIHDVQITTPPLAGSLLMYDATNSLWKANRLTGTANQITVTNADTAVTLSIPTNPTLPGNVTVAGGTVTGGGGPLTLAASGSNQSVTLTPTGAATAGSLSVSRLTSTNQTLALLNYGTDELMSIAGTGYTGVGSRSNTGFLLYSNNTERARFLAGGNFLIAKTIDNALGRLQVNGAITMEETAGTGLFGFFGGSTLVYGSLAANPVVIRTNNTAALTFDTSQNATFAKDILLGTSGPIVQSAIAARASRQGLVFNGGSGATLTNYTFGTTDFTATYWVRHTNAPTAGIYEAAIGAATGGLAINRTPTGVIEVSRSYVASVFAGTTVLAAAKWYHVAVTRSGSSFVLYVNGVQDATATSSPNFNVANGYLGSSPNLTTDRLTGILSQPLFYNRALSAAEVKALYENGVPAAQDIVPQVAGTQLITGNNSTFAGAGSWTSTFGSGTSTVSGGKLLINGGATTYGGSGFMGAALSGTYFVKGYRYRVTVDIDALSSGTLNICEGTGLPPLVAFSGTGTKTADVLVPMSSTDAAVVLCFSVASATATIDNITLVPLGAVIAPDAAQTGSGLTWYDTSGNGANITLPASGVAWNVPFNGRIQFADGTTAAPSLTFSSAPTTGFFRLSSTQIGCTFSGALAGYIWSPSANTIRFAGNSQGYFEAASAGALSIVAAGSNQNISLVPSGTGKMILKLGDVDSQVFVEKRNTADIAFIGGNAAASVARTLYFQGLSVDFGVGGVGEVARFAASTGNLLIGTTVDSGAKLQVGTNTATLAGGMIFGTDTGLYRQATGMLQLDHVGGSNPQFKIATNGTTRGYLRADVNGNLVVNSTGTGSVYLAFDNGTGGVVFGDGAVGAVGGVTSAGNASFNGTLSTGNNVTIRRDQAGNTSQFIDNRNTAGGEVLWFTEDGLSTEYAYIARYNSLHPTTAKRKSLEFGVNGVGAYYNFAAGEVRTVGSVAVGAAAAASKLHVYENTAGTGDSNGITIEQAGAGDSALQFLLTAQQRWTVGIDNSDADKFKIGTGAMGTSDWFTLTTAGAVNFLGTAISQFNSANAQVGMTITNNNAGTGAFASYQTWNGTTGLNLITWGSAFTGRTNENWIYSVGAYPLRFGTDSTIRMMLGGSSGNLLIAGTNDTNNYRVKIYGASTSVVEGLGIYNSTPYAAGSPAESRVSLGRLESSTLQEMGALGALPSSDTSSANGDLVFHARNTNALALVGRWRYTGNLIIGPSGTADNSNGKLQLASHTAITGGIGFGADVSLYRAAANTLKLELGTAAGVLWFDNGGLGTGGARILGSSGALTVTSNGANSLYLQTGGTTRIQIDSGGNSTFTGDVLFSANNTYDVGTTSNRARAIYVRDLFVTNYTPGSATDTGVAGRVCYDTNYIYICTATNTWKRVAIATWP